MLIIALFLAFMAHADGNLFIRAVTNVETGERLDIEIKNGRIARLGAGLKSSVKPVVEGEGLFVMPGLMDSHTHLHSVPGAELRGDPRDKIAAQIEEQMKAYVRSGFTTVMDAAAPESLFHEKFAVAPRILALAPFLTPVGGYFSDEQAHGELYDDIWKPVGDKETVTRYFDKAVSLKALGVKVTTESGFGPVDIWPVFSEELRAQIVADSERTGVPIFVHSMSEEDHRIALTVKPYAFVHAGFDQKVASDKIVQEMKTSGAYVITTAAIYSQILLMWQDLDQPWLKRLVPPEQLVTAADPKMRARVIKLASVMSSPPWMPKFLSEWIGMLFFNERAMRKALANTQKSILKMHQAGIPIVLGSDSGNWPAFSSFFHGVGAQLELEALEEAGIPRRAILEAATRTPAKMLKIDHEVGEIAVGKKADLILLKKNPLDVGFRELRELVAVVQSGVVVEQSRK